MNTYVSDNLRWLNEQRPRAAMAGSLSVANGSTFATPTGSWNDVTINVGGVYTGASNIYGSGATAGAYMVTCHVIFAADADGKRGVCLSSSAAGAGTIYAQETIENIGATEVPAVSVASLVQVAANGKVHIGIRQNSGASMTCAVRFTMWWVAT
jgi:hypothetical protein